MTTIDIIRSLVEALIKSDEGLILHNPSGREFERFTSRNYGKSSSVVISGKDTFAFNSYGRTHDDVMKDLEKNHGFTIDRNKAMYPRVAVPTPGHMVISTSHPQNLPEITSRLGNHWQGIYHHSQHPDDYSDLADDIHHGERPDLSKFKRIK
jgi:hypothetical protein